MKYFVIALMKITYFHLKPAFATYQIPKFVTSIYGAKGNRFKNGTSLRIRFYFVTNKGPCPTGEWFVLEDSTGIPMCESVPENCPIDGHHVYWSPDPSAAKKCWKLNTQGPCAKLQYI